MLACHWRFAIILLIQPWVTSAHFQRGLLSSFPAALRHRGGGGNNGGGHGNEWNIATSQEDSEIDKYIEQLIQGVETDDDVAAAENTTAPLTAEDVVQPAIALVDEKESLNNTNHYSKELVETNTTIALPVIVENNSLMSESLPLSPEETKDDVLSTADEIIIEVEKDQAIKEDEKSVEENESEISETLITKAEVNETTATTEDEEIKMEITTIAEEEEREPQNLTETSELAPEPKEDALKPEKLTKTPDLAPELKEEETEPETLAEAPDVASELKEDEMEPETLAEVQDLASEPKEEGADPETLSATQDLVPEPKADDMEPETLAETTDLVPETKEDELESDNLTIAQGLAPESMEDETIPEDLVEAQDLSLEPKEDKIESEILTKTSDISIETKDERAKPENLAKASGVASAPKEEEKAKPENLTKAQDFAPEPKDELLSTAPKGEKRKKPMTEETPMANNATISSKDVLSLSSNTTSNLTANDGETTSSKSEGESQLPHVAHREPPPRPPNALYRFLLRRGPVGHVIVMFCVWVVEFVRVYLPPVANLLSWIFIRIFGASAGAPGPRYYENAPQGAPKKVNEQYAGFVGTDGTSARGKQRKKATRRADQKAAEQLLRVGSMRTAKYRYVSEAFLRRHRFGPYATMEPSSDLSSDSPVAEAGTEEDEQDVAWVVEALSETSSRPKKRSRRSSSSMSVKPSVSFGLSSERSSSVSVGVGLEVGNYNKAGKKRKRKDSILRVATEVRTSQRKRIVGPRVSDKDGGGGVMGRIRDFGANNPISRSLMGAYPGDAVPPGEAANARGVTELASKYGYGEWSDDEEEEPPVSTTRKKEKKPKKRTPPKQRKSSSTSSKLSVGLQTTPLQKAPSTSGSKRETRKLPLPTTKKLESPQPARTSSEILSPPGIAKPATVTRQKKSPPIVKSPMKGLKKTRRTKKKKISTSLKKPTALVKPPMERLKDKRKSSAEGPSLNKTKRTSTSEKPTSATGTRKIKQTRLRKPALVERLGKEGSSSDKTRRSSTPNKRTERPLIPLSAAKKKAPTRLKKPAKLMKSPTGQPRRKKTSSTQTGPRPDPIKSRQATTPKKPITKPSIPLSNARKTKPASGLRKPTTLKKSPMEQLRGKKISPTQTVPRPDPIKSKQATTPHKPTTQPTRHLSDARKTKPTSLKKPTTLVKPPGQLLKDRKNKKGD